MIALGSQGNVSVKKRVIGIADSAGIVGHGRQPTELVQVQFARVTFIAGISDVSLSGVCVMIRCSSFNRRGYDGLLL